MEGVETSTMAHLEAIKTHQRYLKDPPVFNVKFWDRQMMYEFIPYRGGRQREGQYGEGIYNYRGKKDFIFSGIGAYPLPPLPPGEALFYKKPEGEENTGCSKREVTS